MATEVLSFRLSNGTSTANSLTITPSTVNPLTTTPATSGNWKYFLFYYNGTNQQQTLTCTSTDPTKTVYVLAMAPGGAGGITQENFPFSGGGGAGECFHRQFTSSATVTLNPIITTFPTDTNPITNFPTTTIQSSTFISSTNTSGLFKLRPGGPGVKGSGQQGGLGGSGGGAGGGGGGRGPITSYKNGAGGPAGNDTGTGFSANNGNGWPGYPDYNVNFDVPSTNQTFSDGTSLPRTLTNGAVLKLAAGGIPSYYSTTGKKTYNSQSGNIAGVMFYYKV